MMQTPRSATLQFNLDLHTSPRHEIPADQHDALIEALSQLLLEADSQEEACAKAATGSGDE